MRRAILLGLFAALYMAETVGVDLRLGPGLSLKNLVLYSFLAVLAAEAIVTKSKVRVQLAPIHWTFLLIFLYALVTWYFFAKRDVFNTWTDIKDDNYSPMRDLMQVKARWLDRYVFFLAFFLGVTHIEDALWVVRKAVLLVVLSNILTLIDVYDIPDLGIIYQHETSRVSGPLGEPNQYAAFLVMFLPSIAVAMYLARGLKRLLHLMGVMASFAVLVLTASRGGFAGLLAGLMFGLMLMRHQLGAGKIAKIVFGLTAVLVLVLGIASLQFGDLLQERFIEQTTADDTYKVTSSRSEIWAGLFALLTAQPITYIFGYGWGGADALVTGHGPHNTYLRYLVDLGGIGLTLFLLQLGYVGYIAMQAIERSHGATQLELGAFLVGFLSMLAAIFFVELFLPWYYVWAFIGLMMRVALEVLRQAVPASVQPAHATGGGLSLPSPPSHRATLAVKRPLGAGTGPRRMGE